LNENAKRDYRENDRKPLFILRATKKRNKLKQLANEIKSANGCCYCKENDACCLDFHHIGNKLDGVSELAGRKCMSKMMEEIKKCTVVCANCHRKLHAGKLTKPLRMAMIAPEFLQA
jgi:hypothetical protein